MKIRVNSTTLSFLILVNIILFSFILLILFAIRNNSVNNIPGTISDEYVPTLAKNISDLNVNSKAFIIYDPATRSVLASMNEELRFSPASSAKIMTAAVVLENFPLDKIIAANNISSVEGSKMGLYEGEQISVRNLLYGLMLPSGNDAAFVLSNSYPGGEVAFVSAMNKKVQDLGLKNTRFFDPAGYADDNYTTAYDLARIAAYAMKNSTFAKVVSTKKIKVTDSAGAIVHDLSNINELLGTRGVTGIKTGYTDEAGEVLVTSFVNNGRTYIIVVLGSQDRFGDTKKILKNTILRLIIY
jgi:D-alanyl-D-alanine carboxypeptidase (penicillin-binding protein 5/6)